MSHFVAGLMNFAKLPDEESQKSLASRVVECALAARLHVLLDPNIGQSIVFEILGGDPAEAITTGFRFLLTDSAISNTSDDLVSPWSVEVTDWGEWSPFRENLERIGRFFLAVSKLGQFGGIVVYFSEGFDTSYEEIRVNVGRFADVAFSFFRKAEAIASSKFVILW